jgi:hypothetical protein
VGATLKLFSLDYHLDVQVNILLFNKRTLVLFYKMETMVPI